MQSAMFLALQHNRGQSERAPAVPGASTFQRAEEKRGRVRKTILKDWKARLNYFLQQSPASSQPPANVPGKKGKKYALCRPSPEEALRWSEAFDELLANAYGLTAFRAFLKSEFSEENIEFWMACEDYKKTRSPHKLTSKAKKIYEEFVEKESPKEINIDFETRAMIIKSLPEPSRSCFDAALKRVHSLMENNSYPRFLESEFYRELCRPEISREPQDT